MLRPDAAQAIYQNGRGNGEKEYSYKLKKKQNKKTQQDNTTTQPFITWFQLGYL